MLSDANRLNILLFFLINFFKFLKISKIGRKIDDLRKLQISPIIPHKNPVKI